MFERQQRHSNAVIGWKPSIYGFKRKWGLLIFLKVKYNTIIWLLPEKFAPPATGWLRSQAGSCLLMVTGAPGEARATVNVTA